MVTPYDRVKEAWGSADRRASLNRAVEEMAAEGITRDTLDEALGRLLDEIRAAGADDDTEEIVNGVGDRLHGWCHSSRRITAQPAGRPAGSNGPVTAGKTIHVQTTVLPGGKVEIASPDLPVGRAVQVTITVPEPTPN